LLDDDEKEDLFLGVMIGNLGEDSEGTNEQSSGGSRLGKKANIDRDGEAGHERIVRDYFADPPLYPLQCLDIASECGVLCF
jgi:hypothetical protein